MKALITITLKKSVRDPQGSSGLPMLLDGWALIISKMSGRANILKLNWMRTILKPHRLMLKICAAEFLANPVIEDYKIEIESS